MKSSALGMLGTEQIFPKHFSINLSLKNKWAAGAVLGGRSLGEGRRGRETICLVLLQRTS